MPRPSAPLPSICQSSRARRTVGPGGAAPRSGGVSDGRRRKARTAARPATSPATLHPGARTAKPVNSSSARRRPAAAVVAGAAGGGHRRRRRWRHRCRRSACSSEQSHRPRRARRPTPMLMAAGCADQAAPIRRSAVNSGQRECVCLCSLRTPARQLAQPTMWQCHHGSRLGFRRASLRTFSDLTQAISKIKCTWSY